MSHFRPTTIDEQLHPLSSYITPVYGFRDKHAYVGGTATIIAPGLAVTASHVMSSIMTHFGYAEDSTGIELDVYVTQIQTGASWYVSHQSYWIGTDIAILSLQARNDEAQVASVGQLRMTVDPPLANSTVTALGYPGTELSIDSNDSEELKLRFSVVPTISEGSVIEVHPSFRDTAILRFPCFSVAAKFAAGMSGGAVFNENCELCGLVCSGGKGQLANYSHAASIWPMSLIPVTIPKGVSSDYRLARDRQYKLLELARRGVVSLSGHDRIEFFKHDNGSQGVRRHHPQ